MFNAMSSTATLWVICQLPSRNPTLIFTHIPTHAYAFNRCASAHGGVRVCGHWNGFGGSLQLISNLTLRCCHGTEGSRLASEWHTCALRRCVLRPSSDHQKEPSNVVPLLGVPSCCEILMGWQVGSSTPRQARVLHVDAPRCEGGLLPAPQPQAEPRTPAQVSPPVDRPSLLFLCC